VPKWFDHGVETPKFAPEACKLSATHPG
jgi:hypothetical protein